MENKRFKLLKGNEDETVTCLQAVVLTGAGTTGLGESKGGGLGQRLLTLPPPYHHSPRHVWV